MKLKCKFMSGLVVACFLITTSCARMDLEGATEDNSTSEMISNIDSRSNVEKHVFEMSNDELIAFLTANGFDLESNNEYGVSPEKIIEYAKECSHTVNFTCRDEYASNFPETAKMVADVIRDYENYVDSDAFDIGEAELYNEDLSEYAKKFAQKILSVVEYELPDGVIYGDGVSWSPTFYQSLVNSDGETVGSYNLGWFPLYNEKDGIVTEFYYPYDYSVLNSYYQLETESEPLVVIANITKNIETYDADLDETNTEEKTYWYAFFLNTESYSYYYFSLDASIYTEEDICSLAKSAVFSDDAFSVDLNILSYIDRFSENA